MKNQNALKIKVGVFTITLLLSLFSWSTVGHSELNPTPSQSMSLEEVQALLEKRLLTQKSEFIYIPHLARHILKLCKKHNLDPAVVLSFIKTESSFRTYAVSPVGAIGLMQVMPKTATYLAKKYTLEYRSKKDLYNVYINSEIGITYIAELRRRFKNDYHFIAAYNWGPTAIKREVRLNQFNIQDKQKYVKGILRNIPHIKLQAKNLTTLAEI